MDVPDALGLPRNCALSGPDGEALGPMIVAGRRVWLHTPLTDARLMADAAVDAAEAATPHLPQPGAQILDHNQGGLAATA